VLCFESADSTGVRSVFCGSADSAGLSGEIAGHAGAGLRVGFNTEDTECAEGREIE